MGSGLEAGLEEKPGDRSLMMTPDVTLFSVIRPGTKVGLGPDGSVEGEIHQVAIDLGDGIMYQVSWWNGRDRKTEWLYRDEFNVVAESSCKIGYTP